MWGARRAPRNPRKEPTMTTMILTRAENVPPTTLAARAMAIGGQAIGGWFRTARATGYMVDNNHPYATTVYLNVRETVATLRRIRDWNERTVDRATFEAMLDARY